MGYGKQARNEERSLVRRMLRGDTDALAAFADGYFPSLFRFACSRLDGNTELARDIVSMMEEPWGDEYEVEEELIPMADADDDSTAARVRR